MLYVMNMTLEEATGKQATHSSGAAWNLRLVIICLVKLFLQYKDMY